MIIIEILKKWYFNKEKVHKLKIYFLKIINYRI